MKRLGSSAQALQVNLLKLQVYLLNLQVNPQVNLQMNSRGVRPRRRLRRRAKSQATPEAFGTVGTRQ